MAAADKQARQLARQLFKMSFANDRLSSERITGVLGYLEKTNPANAIAVLKVYQRLVAAELARSQAVVEHAGPISDTILQSIAATMSKRYGRPVSATAKPNPNLLAGLRIRVGDDVYDSSVAAQLAALSASA